MFQLRAVKMPRVFIFSLMQVDIGHFSSIKTRGGLTQWLFPAGF